MKKQSLLTATIQQPKQHALWLLAVLLFAVLNAHAAQRITPAFYYGASSFPQDLRNFNTWVVEPSQFNDPQLIARHQDTLFAYVSLGEVDAKRPYLSKLPAAWLVGDNPTWKSRVIDQSAAGWPRFFVDEIIAPLRQQGYRHFFLDTLDSYHLIAPTPETRQKQEQGMVEAIRLLKSRFPDTRLIVNRGFEILPQIKDQVVAVAAESLFQSWNNTTQRYVSVNENDRTWLLGQLNRIRDDYRLPVIVIDYAPPAERAQARDIAAKIKAYGFIPWVSDGLLAGMGIGTLEPLPRKILMLYDEAPEGDIDLLKESQIHRYAAMPLNYLGYVPEYRNIHTAGLPDASLAGRYAGIVTWFNSAEASHSTALGEWLLRQVDQGVPVATLGYFGFSLAGRPAAQLGFKFQARISRNPIRVLTAVPQAAYEAQPLPLTDEFFPLEADKRAEVWLRTTDGKDTQDAVAITPWGGYALSPFVLSNVTLTDSVSARWLIDPITFFKQALKLPDMPVPDVTTENGKRLLITHIDGDGFASKAEFPGSPWAAEVLYREILQRYPLPTTVSVIEGEMAKTGLYPQLAGTLEPIARKMFALPHVEAASHSYSHPFHWKKLQAGSTDEGYNLQIPGYAYDVDREISGSVRYVDSLLPKGKRCQVFLWTGDCNPSKATLIKTDQAGLLNMNGGETTISRMNPTLTAVAPLGIPRDAIFQVYAPNQNENLYTNLWTGPFYGYERVIETFQLTETPRRLKPINIYYHTYSASKPASLKALKRVYDWALNQSVMPIHASTYIRKVLDFNALTLAREGQGWRIEGGNETRTLRIPARMGYPDLTRSENIVGWWDEGDIRYVHLADAASSLLVLADRPSSRPWLARANGRVSITPTGWAFSGHQPLKLELGGVERCSVKADGKPASLQRTAGGYASLKLAAHHARIEVRCAQ